MFDFVLVVLLGCFVVDVFIQGNNFGKWLLNDVVMCVLNLVDQVGIKVIMVYVIDEWVKVFYEYFGFVQLLVVVNMFFYKI